MSVIKDTFCISFQHHIEYIILILIMYVLLWALPYKHQFWMLLFLSVGGVSILVCSEMCRRWTCLREFWVRGSVCPSVWQLQLCRGCLILMEKRPQPEVRHIPSAAILQTNTRWCCMSSTETLQYSLSVNYVDCSKTV